MKSDRKTRGFRNAHMHAPARLFATAAAALFTASCAELVDNPITSTYLLASSSPTAKAIYIKSLEAKQKSISERRRKIAEARAKMYDSLNNNDLREEAVKLSEKKSPRPDGRRSEAARFLVLYSFKRRKSRRSQQYGNMLLYTGGRKRGSGRILRRRHNIKIFHCKQRRQINPL